MKKNIKLAISSLFILHASSTFAQEANTWSIKTGINHFKMNTDSRDLTGVPGGKIRITDTTNLIGSVSYSMTDHLVTEFTFGTPPSEDIKGAGTLTSAGKIGSFKFFPAAIAMQYKFKDAKSGFRPYVGAALIRAVFRDVNGSPLLSMLTNPGAQTSVSLKNNWGYAIQFGFTYSFTEKLFFDAVISPMNIKTRGTLSTGQSIDATLKPISTKLAVGYQFY